VLKDVVKASTLARIIEKLIKSYEKEIERADSIVIMEQAYYSEDEGIFRKQIVIDFPYYIEGEKKEKRERKLDSYHI